MFIPTPPPTVVASAAPTVAIQPCSVQRSRNAGGFAWASCTVVADNLPASTVGVSFKANLATFNPGTLGPWRKSSGTLAFDGTQGTNQMLSIKFAFKGRSVAQVRSRLKVTLSNATGGATIVAASG